MLLTGLNGAVDQLAMAPAVYVLRREEKMS